jgi:hydroxyatrazine ethylaminohydrolase
MPDTTLIRNASAIVTCDAADTIYHDADILISGPQILQIGGNLPEPADTVIDARGKFVYPGLVNTHHHFFQTFFRNLASIDPRTHIRLRY